METLVEFITRLNLQLIAEYCGEKIPPFSGKSKHQSFHWNCILKNPQGRLTYSPADSGKFPSISIDFYMGLKHIGFRKYDSNFKLTNEWRYATDKEIKQFSCGENTWKQPKPIPPKLLDILSNLHMSATSLQSSPLWLEWADDMGFNSDSISDKKIYEAVCDEVRNVRALLGHTEFEKFLNCENNY